MPECLKLMKLVKGVSRVVKEVNVSIGLHELSH